MNNCEVVEGSVADVVAYPCAKASSEECSDCGIAVCAAHAETCDICNHVFCPSCLSFHNEAHPMPVGAEHRQKRERKTA
jgi:predicted sulfurtransferase